jgi:hypothetical protein
MKARVKTDGNPPSLFVPPGRVGGHVPQFAKPPFHNPIVMILHHLPGFGRGFNREGFASAMRKV